MIIAVGNWGITKASGDEKTVYVRMVANSLKPDRENEEILPQAFNDETVKDFLDNGIIDWHHQSILGKTQEDRAKAILGKPDDFKWENNRPVVYASLTKANPIVQNAILPHLDAGQSVFGASVGGTVRKAQTVIDDRTKKPKKQILSIVWNHLAIAALPYVVSPGTEVSIVKAYGGDDRASDDVMIRYADVSEFCEKYGLIDRGEEIRKALEVGAGTDVAKLTGGDALRMQSLEGGMRPAVVSDLIMGIISGVIEPSHRGIREYLFARGYGMRQIEYIIQQFQEAVRNYAGKYI